MEWTICQNSCNKGKYPRELFSFYEQCVFASHSMKGSTNAFIYSVLNSATCNEILVKAAMLKVCFIIIIYIFCIMWLISMYVYVMDLLTKHLVNISGTKTTATQRMKTLCSRIQQHIKIFVFENLGLSFSYFFEE